MDRDDQSGPNYKKFHIVRLEKYVDEDGEIRKAICYQKDGNELNIWFKYEDIMNAFTNWVTPTPSYYFNGKRWNPGMRYEYAHLEDNTKNNPNPNSKKNNSKKKDSRYTKKDRSNNDDEEEGKQDRRQEHKHHKDEDYWARSNEEALDEMYGYPQNIRAGAGRGSIPHDSSRDHDHHNSENRSRHQNRRDDSPRRHSNDYRDYSRDRYRNRRHSDRSNSRERRRNYEMDSDRKASYGNKGRY